MAERDYTPAEMRLLELHQQLLALSENTEVAGRYILLAPDGTITAAGSLSAPDIDAATDALIAVNVFRAATVEASGRAVYDAMPKTPIDPALENELEEYCIGLDTEHLVALAAQDREAAVAEFDEVTSDVNEDGGPA
jgi:hypothetical protein